MNRFGNWFSRFFRVFLNENPPFYALRSNFFLNGQMPILIDMSDLMAVYCSSPYVRAVIDKKADMFKNMDIKLRNKKTGEIISEHKILELFKQPNPLQNQEDFISQISIYKDIYANAFIYKLKGINQTKVLWNLPPDGMQVIPSGKLFEQYQLEGIIKEYRFEKADYVKIFDVDDIIHVSQGVSENYFVAKSKLESLCLNISNMQGAIKTRNILINEKGALGIISNQSKDADGGIPLGEEERKRIEKSYRENKYGIFDNQMRWIITTANVTWTPMGYPTKDLMLFEEIEDDFQALCSAYGLSRDIFPSTKGATFENQKEALKQTYQNTIQPEADLLMRTFTNQFGLQNDGLELFADYSWLAVMQEDKKQEEETKKIKTERLNMLFTDGIITKEQFAIEMGYEFKAQEDVQSTEDKIRNAQIELRSTVGGTQGIIDLNEAVSNGNMDRQTAINVLINQYGYDATIASSMITSVIKEAID